MDTGESVLFIPKLDDYWAIWVGVIETPEMIQQKYGVDSVLYSSEIQSTVLQLTNNGESKVYTLKTTNTSLYFDSDELTFDRVKLLGFVI